MATENVPVTDRMMNICMIPCSSRLYLRRCLWSIRQLPHLDGSKFSELTWSACLSDVCHLRMPTYEQQQLASLHWFGTAFRQALGHGDILTSLIVLYQKSEMQEKSQVLYVLRLLKNTMHPTSNHLPRRLPTYTTLVFLHALRGIFYPSNFIYPRTSRFLLQRPELDIGDVPMLFSMLYSSSDEWKKERGWIIRMLADGMVSTADWRVLKRRHTWDLLASLFQSSQKDKALRAGILEVSHGHLFSKFTIDVLPRFLQI